MKQIFLPLLFAVSISAADIKPFDLKVPEILLWPDTGGENAAPGSQGKNSPDEWIDQGDGFHRVRNVNRPAMYVFLPPKAKSTGAAFVVCPGGGHRYLVMDLEGSLVAKKLNDMGIAAFVLKSRLQNSPGSTYKAEVESLADAQQAIRIVRKRATEWGLDGARVGIMGFSAGGALAALAETRFDEETRPDFAVLGYPGFKLEDISVKKNSPPTFLVVNNDDNLAPISAGFYLELRKAGVPAELHIYNKGGHGFGMTGRNGEFATLAVAHWPDTLHAWLVERGVVQN